MRRTPLARKPKKAKLTERQKAAKAVKRSKEQEQDQAAALWRKIVYARANNCCEACGKECKPAVFGPDALHAHHIIKRSQSKRLIIDPVNGQALCQGHHQYADRDTGWSLALAEESRPGTAAYLLRERRINTGRKPFEVELQLLHEQAAIYGVAI
jgi:predicted restriction endonuclease